MDVFVARQAILDRNRQLYAYELLFRSSRGSKAFDGADATAATTHVLANTLFAIGLDSMLCGKKAFLNVGRSLLLDGLHSMLPKDIIVLEILETVQADAEVIAACERLRSQGYSIALDDFVSGPQVEPLTRFANVIKVDLRATAPAEQEDIVKRYKARGIRMLAEKVETYEEFRWAKDLGYDYFQGYFFEKPVIVEGRQIPASVVSCLRLLREAQRPELDFDSLGALITEDVAFSYKLLRYVNSALFQQSAPVNSIHAAMMQVGEYQLRRWILLAALPRMAENKPSELATLSVVRAHFCQSVAQLAQMKEHDEAFLVGLFSSLDALVDRPLDEVLSEVKLAPSITAVLLDLSPADAPLAILYQLARKYEVGDWDLVEELAKQLGVPAAAVGDAYLDATRWAGDLLRECDR